MSRTGREVVKLANGGYQYCAFGYSDEGYSNLENTYLGENTGWGKCAIACVDANGNGINTNQFPPTLFVVGTTDTYNTESLQKVDEIKRGGTICKTSEYEGNHNAVSYLKAGTSFTDAIAWMNKWC